MSLQKIQNALSDLEAQNEDLRYRLSFSSTEQESLSARLHDVLLENDALRKQQLDLETCLREERHAIYQREEVVSRIMEEHKIPGQLVEDITYEMEEEKQMLKRRISRAEEDIRARDRLIDEFEMTVDDLHKQYRSNCVNSDMVSHEMRQKLELLEARFQEADHIINQQSAKISLLSARNIELSQSSTRNVELEELYNELVAKYNDQLRSNEELSDKLTATEFDLYATVDKLDLLELSENSPTRNSGPTTVSVGVVTDAVAQELESVKLAVELQQMTDHYDSSQYRIVELSVDNSTLESRIEELEHQVLSYKRALVKSSPRSTRQHSPRQQSPRHSKSSSPTLGQNIAHKLEEFQLENQRREAELTAKLGELTSANQSLTSQVEAYEDEIFELSEQISLIESDKTPVTSSDKNLSIRAISRRLSTMLDQGAMSKLRLNGKSPS